MKHDNIKKQLQFKMSTVFWFLMMTILTIQNNNGV